MQTHTSRHVEDWFAFGLGIGLVVLTAASLPHHHWSFPLLIIGLGALLLFWSVKSWSAPLDLSILVLAWFWFAKPEFFVYLCLNTVVLVTISHIAQSRLLLVVSALTIGGFFLYGQPCAFSQFTIAQWLVTACAVVSIMLEVLERFRPAPPAIHTIDAILCSYSGNTAHYFQYLHQGLSASGAMVRVHRFQYHKTFQSEFSGDALIIVFPVFGWKLPWALLEYLLCRLPNGAGKPAYVAYTAGGGPENAGFAAWLVLSLKGYRVLGKVWSIYPLNVATLRLGPKRFWMWFDQRFSIQREERFAHRVGAAFASGQSAGMPILLWPFPLFIIGTLVENPLVNKIYHHYVWKRRCTRCGRCIRNCPSGRLITSANGYPRANGDCILCLRCINICPTNAMQVFGFSEYGNPYPPKWPELAVQEESRLVKKPGP